MQGQWFLGPDRIFLSAGPRKRARVADPSEAILGLPKVAGDRRSGEECAICLKDFGAEEMLRAMPCSHAFHEHCIFQWLYRNPSCPLCRRRLSPTDDVKEEDEEDGEDEDAWEDSEDEEDGDMYLQYAIWVRRYGDTRV
ncbi:hypothetical protein GQ55_1G020200 [Panicum hallii var. hallii]|uniref:RING-type domain-containing protein n=1 Tax=Panicum hallii var. hallii TaxID=1504633 RepID=A0A2T7F174_9POAL|nr:hypothetical protein GQ55_1G020200 [Panicum hallii var. hallii]